MTENKELIIQQNTGLDLSSPEVIKTLKQTVAKDTTDAEFQMFLALCSSSGLNPFKKEIWCIVTPEKTWTDYKSGDKKKKERQVQMMGGINGFYEIANQDPNFDGLEKGLIGKGGEYLPSTYPKDDFIGAWTKVYRKDRKFPQEETAFLSEYAKDFGNWKIMKRVMIQKCSDALCLRKSFPQKLNGLYIPEEMPHGYDFKEDNKRAVVEVITADELQSKSEVWTGEEIVSGGKHAGKAWKDLSGDYLEWLKNNSKNGLLQATAEKELGRRDEAQQALFEDINKQAEGHLNIDTDEIPAEFTK